MASLKAKDSEINVYDDSIRISIPSNVSISIGGDFYINTKIPKGVKVQEFRENFKGKIPIKKELSFDNIQIDNCEFSFNRVDNGEKMNVNIANSKIVHFDYSPELKGIIYKDSLDFEIKNSILDVGTIKLIANKLNLNVENVKQLDGDIGIPQLSKIFYLSKENLNINTNGGPSNFIEPFYKYLGYAINTQKESMERNMERITRNQDNIKNLISLQNSIGISDIAPQLQDDLPPTRPIEECLSDIEEMDKKTKASVKPKL